MLAGLLFACIYTVGCVYGIFIESTRSKHDTTPMYVKLAVALLCSIIAAALGGVVLYIQ